MWRPPMPSLQASIRVFDIDDTPVAVFNVDGELLAIHDICTHDGGNADRRPGRGAPRSSVPGMAHVSRYARAKCWRHRRMSRYALYGVRVADGRLWLEAEE